MSTATAGIAGDVQARLGRAEARVAELEATLDAIRRGDVDGVIVESPGGPRVFTLQSPDEPYRIFVERMNEGAATLTLEGVILFCNERLAKMLELPIEVILGSPLAHFITPEYVDRFSEFLRTGSIQDTRMEVELRRLEGVTMPGALSVRRIPLEDGTTGLCLIVSDLTAPKKAEATVRELNPELEHRVEARTQELLAANKELESFSYAVSHDLRAPLRHIHGFAEILMRDQQTTLSADGQHCVDCILTSVSRMEALVSHLLNISRLSRQPVVRETTDVKALVIQALAQLAPEISGREIEWRIGELPSWNCDTALAFTVVQNLLSNAVKFTRRKSRAVIEVGEQVVSGIPVVFVKDNGAGFDPKYAQKLFGMFQRMHRHEDFEGSGVGLATVQRIAQRHGGKVWAEGRVDQGATFYFTLQDLGSSERTACGLE